MVAAASPPSDPLDDLAAAYTAEADAHAERVPDEKRRPSPVWAVLSGRIDATESWVGRHGGLGLRRIIRLVWGLIALGGIVLLVGPIINPPLSIDDVTKSADTATERWIARDFEADYTVARDSNGQLTAHVEERIGAFFPADVDESGIQRVLATDYEGHSLDPTQISATLDGNAVQVGRDSSATRLTLSMDAGHRLSGDHTFVLDYQLHNLAYPTTDSATGKTVDLLQWDVFGPSWPQAFAALKVSVTLPDDLADHLIRPPRGELAWLIVGSGEWLTPDNSVAGQSTYEFDSKQNIPPHANAGFIMNFKAGTFTMPQHDALWWVQTFGPAVPLLLLIIALLLALAARAVAWSDAPGRAWYVAQYDPPPGISPRLAAQVLRSSTGVALADSLNAEQAVPKKNRHDPLLATARAARRAGRLGDLPRAIASYLTTQERRGALDTGLRRIPRGFVRDTFIGASIALTLVQWGLVRQLSHQVAFSIVWWPVAFVLVSSAVAIVVLAITFSARPLTKKGAIVRQYLLGIREYVRQTSFLERVTLTDKLLPYAVLVLPSRRAGVRVVQLVGEELGDEDATRGWRSGGYLTIPRLLIRVVAPLAIVAAIVVVSTVPAPLAGTPDYVSYSGDLDGTDAWNVDSAVLAATLSRADSGRAQLAVTETLGLTFNANSARVPQFVQQWPDGYDGQSVRLKVTAITVDGTAVPFAVQHVQDTTLALTRMSTPLAGKHTVAIEYTIASAAVAADTEHGARDQVRWAALLSGWNYATGWGDSVHPVAPFTVSLTMPDDLASTATSSGWLGSDASVPFGKATSSADDFGKATETATSGDGATTHTLQLAASADGLYPSDLAYGDLGSQLDFPAGTFTGPDVGALRSAKFAALLPSLSSITVGGLALIIAAIGIVAGARRRLRVFAVGTLRDLVHLLGPALSIASVILFGWASAHLYGDEPQFPPLIIVSLASFVASIVAIAMTWRLRPARTKVTPAHHDAE